MFSPKYNFIYRVESLALAVDVEDREYIACMWQAVYHYNKYIFNNSKTSLTWLINNDIEFLEQLVRVFGYGKESRINKAVLEKVSQKYFSTQPYSEDELRNLFAYKCSDGKVYIHSDLMHYIVNNIDKKYKTPLEMLYRFASEMVSKDNNSINEGFTQKERYKIAAYAGYYEAIARKRHDIDNPNDPEYTPEGWFPGSFLGNEFVSNPDLLEYIKKNNYFNLPDFDDMIASILGHIDLVTAAYKRTHNF